MSVVSIGDQARAFVLQSASHRLKTTMTTLTAELASGEVSDLAGRLRGNTREMASIASRLSLLTQLQSNAKEAATLTKVMTDVLETVRTVTLQLSTSLVTTPAAHSASTIAVSAAEADEAFGQVVSNLNTAVANRFVFSGLNSDSRPLMPASNILDALETLVAGRTTATGVATAISDWFDAPAGSGGFLDVAYHGSDSGDRTLPIAEGRGEHIAITASTRVLRDQLKGLATAALVGRGVLSSSVQEQQALLHAGGTVLANSSAAFINETAKIGLKQQNITHAQAENSAAIAMLTTLNNTLREADPAATASAITEAETQLKALYSVTARLANLNLVGYLR